MLLSDQLLEIGRSSNPKNNKSMADTALTIIDTTEKQCPNVIQRNSILKFVFNTLSKEGFKLFGQILKETEKETRSRPNGLNKRY
jgi:hypothetical protein